MIADDIKVKVLTEVLPYIQQWKNEIIVMKYGGAAMKQHMHAIQDVLFLSGCGLKLVLVHGGGPVINEWLHKLNKRAEFWQGMRITDSETMEVVEMVLAGKVNKELVSLINAKGGKAVGICGKDGKLIVAKPCTESRLGQVGEIEEIHPELIEILLATNYIPVIASVAASHDGTAYNLNADVVAAELAIKLKAKKVIFLTNTNGILADVEDETSLISKMDIQEAKDKIEQHQVSGGMIPKLNCCIHAVEKGVLAAHIINGTVEHSLLLEILTKEGRGSRIERGRAQ
uniref:Acetylglutamate kinase n=1 Tax=Cyanidiococcus yangmingshanensis TaxID=2690220 RepID=A0A7G5VUL0_9RHOD|nr:acetylglutamate kinase [Cyanidiococcus yangmingshanensis]QMX77377.1 acetylglutamate kinase [Cyanidiococcus yangmingshanensis]